MTVKLAAALIAMTAFAAPAAYATGDTAHPTAGKPASVTERAKTGVEDSAITTKIKAEFAKDKQVSAMHVKVDTENNGVVTLSGTAKSQAEADKAAQIARNTKGVTSVRNEIKVEGSGAAHPTTSGNAGSKTGTGTSGSPKY